MKSYIELEQIIKTEIEAIFEKQAISLCSNNLYEPIKYTLLQGGKRMRPTLLLLACEINGGNYLDAINPAIGLEFFHNMTLIHDDIMDNAEMRRSMPTVYHKWNKSTAILAGDTLFALAIKYMTKTKSDCLQDVLNVFHITSVNICEGQQLDLDFENQETLDISNYFQMIRAKTAVLIAASLKIGAMIGGAAKEQQNMFYQYGENIGIAFQLMDDWLDLYGDVDKFGKKIGGDILCSKKTFLYVKALEIASDDVKEKLINIYNNQDIDGEEKIKEVTNIYDKLNIKDITIRNIRKYQETANEIISKMYLSKEGLDLLKEYSDKLFIRTH